MSDLVPVRASERVRVMEGIAAAILDADRTRRDLAEAGDWESLAWGLDRLRAIRAAFSDVISACEADVAELMPSKRETIDGLGTIERRKGSDRKKWESADLVKRLVRDALDPEGTGEIPSSVPEAVDAAVTVLVECAPFIPSMGWRATALRARGIDPDEWCEVTPGRVGVQFHQVDEQKGLGK